MLASAALDNACSSRGSAVVGTHAARAPAADCSAASSLAVTATAGSSLAVTATAGLGDAAAAYMAAWPVTDGPVAVSSAVASVRHNCTHGALRRARLKQRSCAAVD